MFLTLKYILNYYLTYKTMMHKTIIISSCLLGSVYILGTSLKLINESESLLENKKIPHRLIILNGLTFIISGSIFIYTVSLL